MQPLSDNDTIAAISTPLGEGAMGVVRLSGSRAVEIADEIFQSKNQKKVCEQKNFTSQLGFVTETDGEKNTIDEALLLLMRAPKSYTCEDVVEISVHGGTGVLQATLGLAIKKGARLAQKGEFTKRAFLNGRLDLLQAEAVMDLVKSKTPLGRQWAVRQLEGYFSSAMQNLKREILDVLSHLEASIDFPDDFPDAQSSEALSRRLEACEESVSKILNTARSGALVKNGLRVAITGRPNVGKSSLLNRLARIDRVIVTPYPGTTRDVVEQEIQIGNFPLRLFDTAGIQQTSHPIELQGIEQIGRASCRERV